MLAQIKQVFSSAEVRQKITTSLPAVCRSSWEVFAYMGDFPLSMVPIVPCPYNDCLY